MMLCLASCIASKAKIQDPVVKSFSITYPIKASTAIRPQSLDFSRRHCLSQSFLLFPLCRKRPLNQASNKVHVQSLSQCVRIHQDAVRDATRREPTLVSNKVSPLSHLATEQVLICHKSSLDLSFLFLDGRVQKLFKFMDARFDARS